MSTEVAVFGTLRFPPDRIARVRPHARALVEATLANDGCLRYEIAEDLFDPGLLRFSELWPDRASLDRHLRAPHIAPWRAAAGECGLMERRFTAYDVSDSREV